MNPKIVLFMLFLITILLIYFLVPYQNDTYIVDNITVTKNITPYTIRGNSMEPTLKDGEQVFVNLDYYTTHNISHNDIIAFKFKTREKPFVKRVIAVEGDKLLFLDNGKSSINDFILNEPYIFDSNFSFDQTKLNILLIPLKQTNNTVPKNTIFVLGDNRKNSFDSIDYGFIPIEYVLGKVVY